MAAPEQAWLQSQPWTCSAHNEPDCWRCKYLATFEVENDLELREAILPSEF